VLEEVIVTAPKKTLRLGTGQKSIFKKPQANYKNQLWRAFYNSKNRKNGNTNTADFQEIIYDIAL